MLILIPIGIADVIVLRIESLAQRNHVSAVIICNNVGGLDLIGLSDYITQPTAYRLPVNHVTSLIQNDAVIWKIVLVDEISDVIAIRPVWQTIFLKLSHAVFHSGITKQFPNLCDPGIERIIHLHIGGIQRFRVSSVRVSLGIFFVFSKILPVSEDCEDAALFRSVVK